MFPGITFKVVGEPKDIGAAHQLASEDRSSFSGGHYLLYVLDLLVEMQEAE